MQQLYSMPDLGATVYLMPLYADSTTHYMVSSVGVVRWMRGKGSASLLLRRVCRQADNEGVALYLDIIPDGTGLGFDELRSFYERCGFVQGNWKAEPNVWCRLPGAEMVDSVLYPPRPKDTV